MLPIITLGLPVLASIIVLFIKDIRQIKQFSLIASVLMFISTLIYLPTYLYPTSPNVVSIIGMDSIFFSMDGLSYLLLLLSPCCNHLH